MLKIVLSFFLVIITSAPFLANTPYFYEVTPLRGEGIISLLRKYDLHIHPCNKDKFLELNNLTSSSDLLTGKNYKLPIYIYAFNGQSIRSTINDNNWDKAIRIQKYNQALQQKGLRQSSYDASNILWVPYHEIGCNLPSEPTTSSTNTSTTAKTSEPITDSAGESKNNLYVSLFGEKYAKVKIEDYSLKNKVYYVVSGHGGPDPGAMCKKCPIDLCEDEYAYDISLRLARDLMQHGAKVHIIIQDNNDGIRDEEDLVCDKDEKCLGKYPIPRRQKARLVQRASQINELYRQHKAEGIKYEDQVAIFLHVDSNSESKEQDVYFYHHKNSKYGKKLVNQIKDTFARKYKKHQKGRGYSGTVKGRGLYVLNNTQPTAIFVELANIRNRNDHRRLKIHSNRQAVANWLFEGLTLDK